MKAELERLASQEIAEQMADIELLALVLIELEKGNAEQANELLTKLSPWAGEISVECGQF